MAETPGIPPPDPDDDRWREAHLGRLLGHAMRRFDKRVLVLMAHDAQVPLALSNLAARSQVSAAHIHITRHLPLPGARLVRFTPAGRDWLAGFQRAVAQAEAEFRAEVGNEVATVVAIGLEAYAGGDSVG